MSDLLSAFASGFARFGLAMAVAGGIAWAIDAVIGGRR